MRRTTAAFAITALIVGVVACGGDDDDAESTGDEGVAVTGSDSTVEEGAPGASTSAPAQETTSTTSPALEDVIDDGCLYRNGVVATLGDINGIEVPDYEGDSRTLNRVDVPPDTPEQFLASAPDPDLLESMGVFLYDTEELDPLDVATFLTNQGFVASPILLVQQNGHFILAPGGPHTPTTFGLNVSTTESFGVEDPVVAVVDTGYDPEIGPQWLDNRVRLADPNLDTEQAAGTEFESHTAFIASLIVQFEPTAQVVVAAMPNLEPLADFFTDGVDQDLVNEALATNAAPMTYTSDEFFLLGAIGRLLPLDAEELPSYGALNLSGGTYRCEELPLSGLMTWAAIDYWYSRTDGAPVVAAAGNRTPLGPAMSDEYQFVPGQYNSIPPEVVILGAPGDLFGVQSVDADGELSTFSNSANYMELGEDLCGIHTIDRTNGTLWSGSSFATAIAAARIATGDALTASPPPPSTGSTTTPSTSSGPSATTPPPDIPESMETTLGDCRSSAVLEQPAASTTVGA